MRFAAQHTRHSPVRSRLVTVVLPINKFSAVQVLYCHCNQRNLRFAIVYKDFLWISEALTSFAGGLLQQQPMLSLCIGETRLVTIIPPSANSAYSKYVMYLTLPGGGSQSAACRSHKDQSGVTHRSKLLAQEVAARAAPAHVHTGFVTRARFRDDIVTSAKSLQPSDTAFWPGGIDALHACSRTRRICLLYR